MKNKIVLDEITDNSRYIDLAGFATAVTVTGTYKGDRIVFKNASKKLIDFVDVHIHCTRTEPDGDALVFADTLTDCKITGSNCHIQYGGLTFWGKLENVGIANFTILFPHTGIRFTQDHFHQKVSIINNTIIGASHEGIYCGISKATTNPCNLILIAGNNISTTGWDLIQVGNFKNTYITNNIIKDGEIKRDAGQEHFITINPNSLAWIWNNQITGDGKKIAVLDARCFFEAPDNYSFKGFYFNDIIRLL